SPTRRASDVLTERSAINNRGLQLPWSHLLHSELKTAVVEEQAVAGPHDSWKIERGGDVAGFAFEIADANRQAITPTQRHRGMPAQPSSPNFGSAEILKQPD